MVRRGHELWSGLQATVRAGEFVAVLGPNGVGKSTLLQGILGRLDLACGQVRVQGASPGSSSSAVGYLPQRRSFGAGLNVRGIDIVALGLDGHRWGTPIPFGQRHRARRARVDKVIERVGATSYATRPIGQVSGGEQQRLLIAQALVSDPALLLLDEPLDSLDLPSQSSVAALLGRVCADQKIAVMLVAHDVNPLLPYLDHVIYLAKGSAVSGTPQDVITSETLSQLYRSPIEVLHSSDGRLVVVGQPEAPAHHSDRHEP
ncbi:MAG: ATP-binding cassette domain-containing protein [Actinomycetota bacterium]|nr:ATP-binding cassette domain-containing protein [Actinomycetota bacterium]